MKKTVRLDRRSNVANQTGKWGGAAAELVSIRKGRASLVGDCEGLSRGPYF